MEEGQDNETIIINKDTTINNESDVTDNCNECHGMSSSQEKGFDIQSELDTERYATSHRIGPEHFKELTTEIPGQASPRRTICKGETTRNIEANDLSLEDEPTFREESLDRGEDKENYNGSTRSGTALARSGAYCDGMSEFQQRCQHADPSSGDDSSQRSLETSEVPLRLAWGDDDEEVSRKAREEGRVDVVFPGYVTQEGCCRFVCEILKCVLYQRQQLPMTYDQLVFFQKKQQASTQTDEVVGWRPARPAAGAGGWDGRRCQRTLQELDEVLGHLEVLFSLSLVPRVLLVLGGSLVLPKELYEVNMEAMALGAGEGSLRASACLRQLFRALFVADLLSDVRPVRLAATTVLALGHRDCGVTGFRPKLDFRVPARVKRQVISLACEPYLAAAPPRDDPSDWEDYVWFQVPVTIKGFCK